MKIQILSFLTAAAIAAGMTSCQENEYGVVDLTPVERYTPVDGQYTYNHPCVLYNQADFDRVKNSLADGSAPQAVKDERAAAVMSTRTTPPTPPPTCDAAFQAMRTTPSPCATQPPPTRWLCCGR